MQCDTYYADNSYKQRIKLMYATRPEKHDISNKDTVILIRHTRNLVQYFE